MKKILGMFLMAAIVLAGSTSCKSKQKVTEISGANVEATAKTNTAATTASTTATAATETEKTRNEKFSLAEGETNIAAFNSKYHVVVGSFSIQQNAKNLQRTLNSEGNNALVVVNEQGMFRVLIASFNEYTQARERINQINTRFPDAWVLVQK
ncbi:MAG TPA: SPOR domain-containing protein [Paludibacteraceae bacterium]|jgi:cell division septation protein DedD|nr:SPOR domain-containing protein [Paludibacteraceae bacterium]HPS10647.1 SPOR domain-containing protein [Paludibacteraceae bacterium]